MAGRAQLGKTMKILSDCEEVGGPQRQINCACVVDGGKHLYVEHGCTRLLILSCAWCNSFLSCSLLPVPSSLVPPSLRFPFTPNRLVADCSGRLRVFSCDYRSKVERVGGAGGVGGGASAALVAVRDKLSAAGMESGLDTRDSASIDSGGQLSRHASDISIQDLPADLQSLGEDFGSPQMLMRTLSFSSAVSGSSSRPGSAHGDRGAEGGGYPAEDASRIPIGIASKVGGESSWMLVYNPRSKQVFSLEGAGGLTIWSLVRGCGE